MVMSLGTYNPRKTRCPNLKKRFEDDGLIPIIRPRPYTALMHQKRRRRKPESLPPMTIRVELFTPVNMKKRKVIYDHSASPSIRFCPETAEKVKGWLGKS